MQVCALQWNTHEKEILSSHGFSQNQLCLWKYPSMVKVGIHTASQIIFVLSIVQEGYRVICAGRALTKSHLGSGDWDGFLVMPKERHATATEPLQWQVEPGQTWVLRFQRRS